jgi:hypothetical protein
MIGESRMIESSSPSDFYLEVSPARALHLQTGSLCFSHDERSGMNDDFRTRPLESALRLLMAMIHPASLSRTQSQGLQPES